MAKLAKRLIGDTMRITWVSSGVVPTQLSLAIFNGSESLVNSTPMLVNSEAGQIGHYYGLYTLPNTPGFYVAETLATLSGNPYKDRLKFKVVTGDADG